VLHHVVDASAAGGRGSEHALGLARVVLVNFYCFPLVFRRAGTTDEARAQALSRRIKLTGAGIPLAIAAFVIGVAFLRP
jgi:hypothetical protein